MRYNRLALVSIIGFIGLSFLDFKKNFMTFSLTLVVENSNDTLMEKLTAQVIKNIQVFNFLK